MSACSLRSPGLPEETPPPAWFLVKPKTPCAHIVGTLALKGSLYIYIYIIDTLRPKYLLYGYMEPLGKGFNLSYHNQKTILFTIDPYYGNLIYIP